MNPRIANISRILSILASLFIVIIPTTVLAIWLLGSEETLLSELPHYWFVPAGIRFQIGTLDESTRLLSAGISLAANLPLILALWQLRKLLELYRRLDVFQSEAAPRMKKFAMYIVGFAILQPFAGAALSFVTSMNNPPGHHVVSVSIADTEVATIFVGVTMIVIAYVLEEAHRLAEDNKSFI